MTQSTYNELAANILGTIGTVCWCIQLIPQIVHNYRRKDCTGLQPIMLFLWSASGVPFSIYFVSRRSTIPIMVQPQIFTTLCLVTWFQSLIYPPVKIGYKKAIIYTVAFVAISLVLEFGFIFPLRKAYDKGIMWPSLIFGIIASVLLAVGLVPPYFELAKRQGEVVGINFMFLTLDSMGAWFSILSLIFSAELDILGIVLYCIVAVMELGIFVSHVVWWFRIGRLKKNLLNDEESGVNGNENGLNLDPAATESSDLVNVENQLYSIDSGYSDLKSKETNI
ncbi:hypothetical protein WICPIJ_005161 [Wickerhamomyces pijperi]|uniref:PQ-loop-domain-containing protein n=1 Tax=Wickerhamomyces pijperi TaxID=599730 RepID=A0A9P8Q698_WICPI|nr:hypothetical protein WICPIJ_005161 [Wickerhamomyces pijperi]